MKKTSDTNDNYKLDTFPKVPASQIDNEVANTFIIPCDKEDVEGGIMRIMNIINKKIMNNPDAKGFGVSGPYDL